MTDKNLIETAYLAYQQIYPRCPIDRLRRDCNQDMDRNDSRQRWSEWRHGRRAIPEPVVSWLMIQALGETMRRHGYEVDYDDINSMVDALSPPERQ